MLLALNIDLCMQLRDKTFPSSKSSACDVARMMKTESAVPNPGTAKKLTPPKFPHLLLCVPKVPGIQGFSLQIGKISLRDAPSKEIFGAKNASLH